MPKVSLGNETELMRRIIDRDESALTELYERCSGPVYSLALRVLQNADLAEETLQDVFLKVWNQPAMWRSSEGKLISWLLTITRYTAIDRLRRERRHTDGAIALDESEPAEATDLTAMLTTDALLSQLPSEQRAVIELAYFQGLSHTDIASYTKIPLGTVKTRLRLGMEKLRDIWRRQNEIE
jgi:RNA polymerase sigma-70 factor (ECF subfamily)